LAPENEIFGMKCLKLDLSKASMSVSIEELAKAKVMHSLSSKTERMLKRLTKNMITMSGMDGDYDLIGIKASIKN